MIEFLQIALSLPTVLFTTLLGVVLAYWLFVILGALDIDALDGSADGAIDGAAHGAVDGAAHGALEGATHGAVDGAVDGAAHGALEGATHGAIDGAAHGALEGATHGAIDGAAHGALEGATHGAVDGAAHGALEGAAHGAADGVADGVADGALDGVAHTGGIEHSDISGVVHDASLGLGLVAFLRFGKVPATVILSVLALWAWLCTFIGAFVVSSMGLSGLVSGLASLGVGLSGLLVAIPLCSLTVRPMEKLFLTSTHHGQETLIGQTCRITSLRVDHRFGTASYQDGGAGLILNVRCERENNLTKGREALIVGYLHIQNTYQVEPIHDTLYGGKRNP